MDLRELERKLLQAARHQPPSAQVPYAFEQRIMARLRATPPVDVMAYWSRMLWRMAMPCLALVVALFVWSYSNGAPPDNLADEFERTLFAGISQAVESW